MAKPSIILVPGCWPYVNGRLAEVQDDSDAVRAAVLTELDSGNNVVLVTHSYSSIPGTAALYDLNAAARSAAGRTSSVTSAVIISGFLAPTGTNMIEASGGELPPQFFVEGDTTLPFAGPGAIHILYNDLEPNEAFKAIHRLQPQSYACATSSTPDQVKGMHNIPLSCLCCENDNAVPFEMQQEFVKAWRSVGIDTYAEVATSGHSPFLKLPTETSKFIRKAAGEEIDTGFQSIEEYLK